MLEDLKNNFGAKSYSVINDGKKCVHGLLEKYKGAEITQDLLSRIALEAFVQARLESSGYDHSRPRVAS